MPSDDYRFLERSRPHLEREIKRITPAECGEIITRLLSKYYVAGTAQSLAADKADWYFVLKEHEAQTVNGAALAWMTDAKRRPAPAEIRALCDEADDRIVLLRRLNTLLTCARPVDPRLVEELPKDSPMLGCPIRLASLMRQAAAGDICFPEILQIDYLKTGKEPSWARPDVVERPVEGMPSRDELLAQMATEQRVQALTKPHDDWKQAGV